MTGIGLSHGIRQEIAIKISLEQKRGYLLEMKLALTGFRSNEKIDVSERCPKCRRSLTPIEVMDGFNSDPRDFNTTCPDCRMRWQPEINVYSFHNKRRAHYQLYCPSQALFAIKQYAEKTLTEIDAADPALYRAAILHFGSIKAAMKEAGIIYRPKEIVAWKTKFLPVLGKVTDVVFARYAGVTPATVSRFRRAKGIPRFSIRNVYE